jgi:hypothetical protein
MNKFKSFLAPQLQQYVIYRHNLGYSMKASLSHLKTFDRLRRISIIDGPIFKQYDGSKMGYRVNIFLAIVMELILVISSILE